MPLEQLSHFDEKSGVVACTAPWGRWWQTVHEVHIEVNLPENTKAKDVSVVVKTTHIECVICKKSLFKGDVPGPLHADETVWTIEDGQLLSIVLSKADHAIKDKMWKSLLSDDDSSRPDPFTLHEMRKKLDLERFQIENPGMDFSRAKLDKKYDQLPGWSQEKLKTQKKEDETVGLETKPLP